MDQISHLPLAEILNSYLFTLPQLNFYKQIQAFFQEKNFLEAIENLNNVLEEREIDPRPLYKLIGEAGLLAAHWPKIYGGQDKTMVEMAIVAEEMVNIQIPETLFVLSIQIVGNLLLLLGTPEQKSRWLPDLAAGKSFACVLYSECHAGSDLATLETKAIRINDSYYEITGKKVYSLKTQFCDYGLCAVRTNEEGSKYDGMSIFLVPLKSEGIQINQIPSLADEVFNEVIFNKVQVSKDNIIGKINEGWTVISKTLMLERTGLDCILKANHALNVITKCLMAQDAVNDDIKKQIDSFYCKRDAVRILSFSLLEQYDEEQYIDESKAAIAKLYASELVLEIMHFGVKHINVTKLSEKSSDELLKNFSTLYRDTPGVTISAGTSEMMLETIARFQFERGTD